jgi:hypothetical protein
MRCPYFTIVQVVRCLEYARGNMKIIPYIQKTGYQNDVTCSNDKNLHIYIAFR